MTVATPVLTLTEGMHRCPAHDDGRASLSVRRGRDRRWLLHDFGGCPVETILRAAGLTFADLFPSNVTRPSRPPRRQHWRDAIEQPLLARERRAAARLAPYRLIFEMCDDIREDRQTVAGARRMASRHGDREDSWDLLLAAADLERSASLLEAEVDHALVGLHRDR